MELEARRERTRAVGGAGVGRQRRRGRATALVGRRINPGLRVSGVVVCLYDGSTKLAQEVVRDLKVFLDGIGQR